MVFLDKPHIKQFNDIFDTSIKNLFIFNIYIYYYLNSIYNLGIHYLIFNYSNIDYLFSSVWFLLINSFCSILSFYYIYQNNYLLDFNKNSHTVLSIFSSNTIISILTNIYSHHFILSIEIITNIILFCIVIYTIKYKSENFIVSKLLNILYIFYPITLFLLKYFNIISNHQFFYILIYSLIFITLHLQNIKVITKRYMSNDYYLAYLNIYFILIDILNIILFDIIEEIFFQKKKV